MVRVRVRNLKRVKVMFCGWNQGSCGHLDRQIPTHAQVETLNASPIRGFIRRRYLHWQSRDPQVPR